jgi:ribosome-associated toxin RatA of RatAB toxin-antitoxin module
MNVTSATASLLDSVREPSSASLNLQPFTSLHSGNSVLIRAPRERIFQVVSDLARWPERLPHYRFVRFTGKEPGGRDLVHMSARRSGLPISWFSAYEADAERMELRFEHLRAWTKGMLVVWTLTPTRDGTRVEIVHDLGFRVPVLAWLCEPIIGGFFIDNIAARTLATFKQIIERAESAENAEAPREDQP